jgi:signal transduction histidine kinase
MTQGVPGDRMSGVRERRRAMWTASRKGFRVNRPTKAIALAAPTVTVMLVMATAVLFVLDGFFGPDPVFDAIGLLGIACYALIGGLIAWRLPTNACGWLLLLIGGGLALALFTDALTTLALREGYAVLAPWADWVNAILFFPTLAAIPLYLLVFPTGRPPSRRWRPVAIVVIALSVAGTLVNALAPSGDVAVENPIEVSRIAPVLDPLIALITFAFVAGAVACVASVVVRWRRAGVSERLQLRWLVVVAVLAAALLVGAIAFGALGLHRIGDPLGVAFLLMLVAGLPVSTGIALLKHHVHGIEVVANRSIVYGTLAAFITLLYAVVVAGAGALVGRSERSNALLAVAATVAAAIIFNPARQRAQRIGDRLIYGDRASPYELVSTFTDRLDVASLDGVLPQMAELVAKGTGAQAVRVWLRSDDALRSAAGWPPDHVQQSPLPLDDGELPMSFEHAFPVRHSGHLLGAITVEMPPQEPMTLSTERLIADLSAQAGLVLRNVSLLEELQLSRQRLVTSHDEERRRLERDLHDGAQQRLVALSMELRVARSRAAESDDSELSTRLDTAAAELTQSLAELRELARGIHPAILTQNGLGAALRSLADRSSVRVEIRCVPEGRFVPEVEATTYFLVSEALANTAKHADASRAFVSVRVEAGHLVIDVTDDGRGGAQMSGGSGLRGLADRVGAVGGRLDVRSRSGSGTTVHAEIPCA